MEIVVYNRAILLLTTRQRGDVPRRVPAAWMQSEDAESFDPVGRFRGIRYTHGHLMLPRPDAYRRRVRLALWQPDQHSVIAISSNTGYRLAIGTNSSAGEPAVTGKQRWT